MGRIKSWGRKTTSEDSQYQQPRVIGVLRPDVLSSYWRKFFFFFKSNKNEPPPPSIHQQHHPLLRHDEWNNEFRSSLRFMITPSKVWLSVFVLIQCKHLCNDNLIVMVLYHYQEKKKILLFIMVIWYHLLLAQLCCLVLIETFTTWRTFKVSTTWTSTLSSWNQGPAFLKCQLFKLLPSFL